MKGIFMLSFLCLVVAGAFGQKQEISFGVGSMSRPAFKTIRPFRNVLSDGGDDFTVSPVYHFSYARLILPRLNAGITIAYEHQSHNSYSIIPGFQGMHHVYREAYFTGLLYAHYKWIQKSILKVYSGIGLGWNFMKQTNERNDFKRYRETQVARSAFAYQATLFGLRLGKKLAGYAELGYGYKGLALCGISYRF